MSHPDGWGRHATVLTRRALACTVADGIGAARVRVIQGMVHPCQDTQGGKQQGSICMVKGHQLA